MIIGTLCFSHSARSCSSRLFDRCTIWFTANGAASRPGLALSCAASSSLIRASHSSSSAGGRAFSAGNDPTIPALHCAITRSGTEMMNSGAPITGIDRRPRNKAGTDIWQNPLAYSGEGVRHGPEDARHHTNKAIAPATRWPRQPNPASLTQRSGHVIVSPAVVRFSGPAGDQQLRGAFFRGIDREALALLETLSLAEPVGADLAVRRAVGRNRTYHAPRHHRGWLGQARHRLAPILCARVEVVDGLRRAFQ